MYDNFALAHRVGSACLAHPVKGELAVRGIRYAEAARATGYSPNYFRRVISGIAPASPAFRRSVASWLGLPQYELFRVDGQPLINEASKLCDDGAA